MHRRPPRASLSFETLLFTIVTFFVFGCDTLSTSGLGDSGLQISEQGSDGASDKTLIGLFESAQPVTLPDDTVVQVDGTIDSKDDIDVYAIGPAQIGDRITVDVAGVG